MESIEIIQSSDFKNNTLNVIIGIRSDCGTEDGDCHRNVILGSENIVKSGNDNLVVGNNNQVKGHRNIIFGSNLVVCGNDKVIIQESYLSILEGKDLKMYTIFVLINELNKTFGVRSSENLPLDVQTPDNNAAKSVDLSESQ